MVVCKLIGFAIVLFGVYVAFLLRNGPASSIHGVVFPPEYVISGTTTPQFEAVRKVFRDNFENGLEAGAQLAVYYKGAKVVDLWGKNPYVVPSYSRNSMQRVYSSSKMIECLVATMWVDRGLFQWDDKISKHWPEFGQNGKEDITVTDLMKHEAGLFALKEDITIDLARAYTQGNPAPIASIIEQSTPVWFGDSRRSYHAFSRGWVLAELVRRVDPKHRLLHEIVSEEIAKPLNIDFYFGVPEDKLSDVVPLFTAPTPWLLGTFLVTTQNNHSTANIMAPYFLEDFGLPFLPQLDDEMKKMLEISLSKNESHMIRAMKAFSLGDGINSGDPLNWNTAYNLSLGGSFGMRLVSAINTNCDMSGGIATGSALASIASIFANKGLHGETGISLFSEKTWKEASVCHEKVTDNALGVTTSFTTAGFSCGVFGENWYGWGGWGGSILLWRNGANEKEAGIALGYAMNQMGVQLTRDPRNRKIVAILEEITEAK